MKNILIAAVSVLSCGSAVAQENWANAPVPPALGSAGIVSGSEYVTAECNRRVPGNFLCADNPSAVREVYIPLSSFARATTVDALRGNVTDMQTQVSELGSKIDGLDTQIGALGSRLNAFEASSEAALRADRNAARRGIAAAVAIGSASMPSAPGRTSYDFNLATYRGQQAVGGSLKHRLATVDPIAVSVGFSIAGRGDNSARVGVSGEF